VLDQDRPLTQLDDRGRYVRLDPGALRRQRRKMLAEKARTFGVGSAPPGLFALGPARMLQGRLLSEIPKGRPLAGGVKLRDSGELDDVDLSSPFVPALLRGKLLGAGGRARFVAVAVNGRIAGTGFAFPYRGEAHFEVMFDPRWLRNGANDVRMLAVAWAAGGPRVHIVR
jgi:hypothetical protein